MLSNIQSLKELLKTTKEDSCPRTLNFHTHTIYSDGSLTPLQLIQQASEIGLKHLSITDHHSINAYLIANKWLLSMSNKKNLPKLWSGIEISCVLNKCLVHILGYGFNVNSKYLLPYINNEAPVGQDLQAANVIEAIKKSDGISILAHPARYRLTYKQVIDYAYEYNIDGIETWYDYDMSLKWKPTEHLCKLISSYTSKYNMLQSCGTDTHGLSLMSR